MDDQSNARPGFAVWVLIMGLFALFFLVTGFQANDVTFALVMVAALVFFTGLFVWVIPMLHRRWMLSERALAMEKQKAKTAAASELRGAKLGDDGELIPGDTNDYFYDEANKADATKQQ